MIRKNLSFWGVLLVILCPLNAAFSSSLSGTIKDTLGANLSGVTVRLIGKGPTTYSDSSLSSSSGQFSLQSFPIGLFSLQIEKEGYYPKDTGLVLGNSDYTLNFRLKNKPVGTMHSDTVTGVWSPEGNPHWLEGNVTIKDSLYIMPGCTVNCRHSFIFGGTGKLIIGKKGAKRTTITDSYLTSSNIVKFENTDIVLTTFAVVQAKEITIDSCRLDRIAQPINFEADTIIIKSSEIVNAIVGLPCGANKLQISGNKFGGSSLNVKANGKTKLTLKNNVIGKVLSNGQTQGGVTIDGSVSGIVIAGEIRHNNLGIFSYETRLDSLMITDNIVLEMYHDFNAYDPYACVFRSNLFNGWFNTGYIGFCQNIQVNANNDSCDLWMNLRADPKFTGSDCFGLQTSSPAIGVASDSTNIGCYQGPIPVGVREKSYVSRPSGNLKFYVSQTKGTANLIVRFPNAIDQARITLYNLKGVALLEADGKRVDRMELECSCLPAGAYVMKVQIMNRVYSQSVMVP